MYFVMPLSMSTLSLDDGARFKVWRETFITKIVLAYGTVFSVNIFVLLLPMITKMHNDGVSGFGNAMFIIFMIVGGAMVIPAGQALFAKLFGQADDMHAGGNFLRSAFYGSRMVGAATFGLAHKIIHGGVGIGKAIANTKKISRATAARIVRTSIPKTRLRTAKARKVREKVVKANKKAEIYKRVKSPQTS